MKRIFGSYSWSVILGVLAGYIDSIGAHSLPLFLLIIAVLNALYKEFQAGESKWRKTIGMLVVLVISPVIFMWVTDMTLKFILKA